jgi:hypothetical protein
MSNQCYMPVQFRWRQTKSTLCTVRLGLLSKRGLDPFRTLLSSTLLHPQGHSGIWPRAVSSIAPSLGKWRPCVQTRLCTHILLQLLSGRRTKTFHKRRRGGNNKKNYLSQGARSQAQVCRVLVARALAKVSTLRACCRTRAHGKQCPKTMAGYTRIANRPRKSSRAMGHGRTSNWPTSRQRDTSDNSPGCSWHHAVH